VVDCPLCRISEGLEPALFVRQTDSVICFLPLRMEAPGHTLVAPREHVEGIYEASIATWVQVIEETQVIARDYRARLGATGINLLHASGVDAQQSVNHLHLHLIPRWPDDGLDTWPVFPHVELDRNVEFRRLTSGF
jgi:histidine triad (HIT) family protein